MKASCGYTWAKYLKPVPCVQAKEQIYSNLFFISSVFLSGLLGTGPGPERTILEWDKGSTYSDGRQGVNKQDNFREQ